MPIEILPGLIRRLAKAATSFTHDFGAMGPGGPPAQWKSYVMMRIRSAALPRRP